MLSPLYEPTFHPNSHGFMSGRSCHTAIAQAVKYLEEGCGIVVDLDLDKSLTGSIGSGFWTG